MEEGGRKGKESEEEGREKGVARWRGGGSQWCGDSFHYTGRMTNDLARDWPPPKLT